MNDRELLELASKAAGVEIYKWLPDGSPSTFVQKWNPLTDDGDALRLAVKLGLEILIGAFGNVKYNNTYIEMYPKESIREMHKSDAMRATRRAIVRAAAEIGSSTSCKQPDTADK